MRSALPPGNPPLSLVRITSAKIQPEQPYTLDLRRYSLGTPMPRDEEWDPR